MMSRKYWSSMNADINFILLRKQMSQSDTFEKKLLREFTSKWGITPPQILGKAVSSETSKDVKLPKSSKKSK